MLNAGWNLHGGCTMFMIDVYVHRGWTVRRCQRSRHRCSSITLLVLGIARDTRVDLVSQAITTVFHAPATMYVCPLRTSIGIPHLTTHRYLLEARGSAS